MKLHFLGTTGYHPNNTRQTACLMLPEIGVILDAGTGLFRAGPLIKTREIKIFLTHAHLDHIIGLTFLFDVLHEKDVDVTIFLEPSKMDAITNHLFHSDLFPIQPEFELKPFDGSPVALADGSALTTFPLQHPGGCNGFRIDWVDRSMAYVTDTIADVGADYVPKIEDVDLLVHECYFPDGFEEKARITGHSCLTPVAEVAKTSKARRIMLVHTNPLDEFGVQLDLNSVADICPDLEIANDGQIVEF